MRPSSTNPSSRPAEGARPVWVRGIMLAAIWTLVLQPAVSSAQLAQSPMFTVTSAPPNVMLMFDDSSSMNRLDLNPSPAYTAPAAVVEIPMGHRCPAAENQHGRLFRLSGMAYYFGGQPIGGWTDGYWNFGWADVLPARLRSTRSLTTPRFSICRGTTTGFVSRILRLAGRATSQSARMPNGILVICRLRWGAERCSAN